MFLPRTTAAGGKSFTLGARGEPADQVVLWLQHRLFGGRNAGSSYCSAIGSALRIEYCSLRPHQRSGDCSAALPAKLLAFDRVGGWTPIYHQNRP
jgi:hypothetical protein